MQKISYLNLSLLQLYTYLRKSYKIVYIDIIKNESIINSLKDILNNHNIEDIYINEPPIDEIIGEILIKKEYKI